VRWPVKQILGPRVLPSGDASLKKNSRNLNPNVPVYTWNSDSSINPEHLITCVLACLSSVHPHGRRDFFWTSFSLTLWGLGFGWM